MTLNKLFLVAVALCVFMCCTRTSPNGGALGDVEFTVTGKPEAQPYFVKGLLLLHSFEYEDAAEAFQKAKTIDPDFAMAYWGEAMTQHHILWRYQNYEKADSILRQLAPTPEGRVEKAKTEIEKEFITAVNILFGKGTKTERDSAYAAYMGELYKKYPGNNEVAAFYSIALIGSVPVGRDKKVYELAADIGKEILARNPKHPGALHYVIHAYDDPDHAMLAMETADAYSVVAPDAGHALHMPSHIYLASGLWDKVISSNEAAWAAGVKRKEQKQLTNDAMNYHALHWLQYGYLQRGRTADAKKLVEDMQTYCNTLPSERGRSHLIYLKATYCVETNNYASPVASIAVDKNNLNISTRAQDHFVNGMKAYYDGDCLAVDSIIQLMTAERLLETEKSAGDNARTCSGINSVTADALDIQNSQVMELELRAIQAQMHADDTATEKFLKQAVELESSGSFLYGPPTVVKPSYELFGEWLLDNNRPAEALQQFEHTLRVNPGRVLAVKGKEKAEKMAKTI